MRDLSADVTNQMIAAIDAGTRPWVQSWTCAKRSSQALPKRHNGERYRGINVVILWAAATAAGYSAPVWMTYKQAADLGGQVRKGERGATVVFSSAVKRTEAEEDTGETAERVIPFLRSYVVFNVQQIDNLPVHFYPTDEQQGGEAAQAIEAAERLFATTGACVRHGGERAYYNAGADYIQLPHPADFKDPVAYAATKGHELVHWTGHPSRCGREYGKRFGDDAYAFEELVAELGAAFLCAELGILNQVRDDHAAYLASWLRVLKNDKRAIFTAASKAQGAMDFILASGGGVEIGETRDAA